mgnify:CR=1 FL=1
MKITGEAKLLRIFIGESDKIGSTSLHEKIVVEARSAGLAGATVHRGIMGFGGNSRIHTSKILRLSEDLPIIVEIVDEANKIKEFVEIINTLFDEAKCGGLITIEKADIIRYVSNSNR